MDDDDDADLDVNDREVNDVAADWYHGKKNIALNARVPKLSVQQNQIKKQTIYKIKQI